MTRDRDAVDWRHHAACLGADIDEWFPEGTVGYALARDAFATCHACPVQAACLQWALDAEGSMPVNCRAGIWGGTTPTERHRLYRQRAERRTAA